jgi:hypothetical protein
MASHASSSFKARPMPRASAATTPAAMKAARRAQEEARQVFRAKVEAFYRQHLPRKWEKCRDLLLVKYAAGDKYKQFSRMLSEKYGDKFTQFTFDASGTAASGGTASSSSSSSSSFSGFNGAYGGARVEEEVRADGRVPCACCGRKFVLSRVYEHEAICAKNKSGPAGTGRRGGGGCSDGSSGGSRKIRTRRRVGKDAVRLTETRPEEDVGGDEEEEEEEEDDDAAALAMAAKLEGMTEIERLEYQISQMKMLQALKAGGAQTCPPGCKC